MAKTKRKTRKAMYSKFPLMNEYWADKRAKMENIEVPAYVLASMSTALHTVGSFRGYEDIKHDKKWLRVHQTQEWHDLYQPENIADFKKFLDFHTKGIDNDWTTTPKVRVSVLRYNQPPMMNIPFDGYPVPGTIWQRFYLAADNRLKLSAENKESSLSYQSDVPAQQIDADREEITFSYTLPEKCTLIGPSKATVFIKCDDHDDMDVFVQIRKADKNGKVLRNVNIPLNELALKSDGEVENLNTLKYLGPTGVLRASHRVLDPVLSKPHWPAPDHTKEEKIPPGEIAKLEIGMWPAAMQWEAGENLILKISGHQMTLAEFPPLRGSFRSANKGKHTVLFGGQYDSRLEIPTVQI